MSRRKFYTRDLIRKKYRANVGAFTYGTPTVFDQGEGAVLRIGKCCSIAPNVTIFLGGNHRTDWVSTYPFPALPDEWPEAAGIAGHPASRGDVVIGNDVWIGYGSTIFSGVHVGDGAVIAAQSVVRANVAPYTVVGGNPAEFLQTRFDPATVRRLLEVRWWDLPSELVGRLSPFLCSNDLDAFFAEHARLTSAVSGDPSTGSATPQLPRRPRLGRVARALRRLRSWVQSEDRE